MTIDIDAIEARAHRRTNTWANADLRRLDREIDGWGPG